MKFKPGDKVKCIDPKLYSYLEENEIYTVDKYRTNNEIIIKELQGSWHESRFELTVPPNNITSSIEYSQKAMLPITAQCVQNQMKVSATGGLRDNKNKPRLSLVPSSLDKAVAQVIFKSSIEGGGKYPMHNWRKGLPWTEVADSSIRHIRDFLDGKDLDKESGLHTLYHAATNIAFLIEYLETCPELDDRYKREDK